MTHYDYKVVPAPKRAKKVKGIRAPEELFALTLTEAINEVARQGWEYVRAEHLQAEASRGWFRSASHGEQAVLVFRRTRETLGPRLAAVRAEPEAAPPEAPAPLPAPAPPLPAVEAPTPPAERAVVDRMQSSFRRREPALHFDDAPDDVAATPLRPSPRLGPAKEP
jgi:hypothetical protein